jgi:hypothetical protein
MMKPCHSARELVAGAVQRLAADPVGLLQISIANHRVISTPIANLTESRYNVAVNISQQRWDKIFPPEKNLLNPPKAKLITDCSPEYRCMEDDCPHCQGCCGCIGCGFDCGCLCS